MVKIFFRIWVYIVGFFAGVVDGVLGFISGVGLIGVGIVMIVLESRTPSHKCSPASAFLRQNGRLRGKGRPGSQYRDSAAEQGIAEEEALKKGWEEKLKGGYRKGCETLRENVACLPTNAHDSALQRKLESRLCHCRCRASAAQVELEFRVRLRG